MNSRFRLSCSILPFFLLFTPLLAQPQQRDTVRHGPIFHLVGGSQQDLGTLYPQRYKGVMYITNLGDSTLRILRLQNSGANILATLRDSVIAPGDTGTIDVIGDFTSRMGLNMKSCTIMTNDPDNSEYRINFRVFVRPYITADPASTYINIGRIDPGTEWDTAVVLRPAYDTTVTLYPAIVEENVSGYTVTTDLTDTVKLKFGEERKVQIRVKAEREATYSPSPGRIWFPTAPPSSIVYTLLADSENARRAWPCRECPRVQFKRQKEKFKTSSPLRRSGFPRSEKTGWVPPMQCPRVYHLHRQTRPICYTICGRKTFVATAVPAPQYRLLYVRASISFLARTVLRMKRPPF